MASLFGCFIPRRRGPSLSVAAVTSLIVQRHSAIAWISGLLNYEVQDQQSGDASIRGGAEVHSRGYDGLGVLIYPSLLLTTHKTVPSPAAVANAELHLRFSDASLNILRRRLLPHLFFITSADLNLTLVACEFVAPEMHPLGLDSTKLENKALNLGNKVYVLGYDKHRGEAMKFSVGSGYIVNRVAKFVEIRTRNETWMEGSAGFDQNGNFAFIITDCEAHDSTPSRSKGVTVKKIGEWLDPQWKVHRTLVDATKTERTSPQGLTYTRRATYSGPDASYTAEACARELDQKNQGNDDGEDKKDHDDDRPNIHHQEKSPHIRVVDVGTGKPALKKDAKKASNAKEKVVRTRKVASFSETASPNVSTPVRASSGFEAKVTLAVKDDKKKKSSLYQSKDTERRRNPTLHKTLQQQDRAALQIRLTDLGKD